MGFGEPPPARLGPESVCAVLWGGAVLAEAGFGRAWCGGPRASAASSPPLKVEVGQALGLAWTGLPSLMSKCMCKTGTVQKLPRGGTSRPRPGVVAQISNPTPKEQWLHRLRRVQRNYSTCKVRKEA